MVKNLMVESVHPGKLTRNPNMEDDFNFQSGEF